MTEEEERDRQRKERWTEKEDRDKERRDGQRKKIETKKG